MVRSVAQRRVSNHGLWVQASWPRPPPSFETRGLRPRSSGRGRSIGRRKKLPPGAIEDHLGGVERRHRKLIAVAAEQLEPFQLRQGLADLERDRDAERVLEPSLDPPLQLVLRRRRRSRRGEIIGEERLLALLLLGSPDDGFEHAGIVVGVAEIDVVGNLLVILERLALELEPLPYQEAAERHQAAERGERLPG